MVPYFFVMKNTKNKKNIKNTVPKFICFEKYNSFKKYQNDVQYVFKNRSQEPFSNMPLYSEKVKEIIITAKKKMNSF